MDEDHKFEGWVGHAALGDMEWECFEVKPWEEKRDVDIRITHCGICGSDIHALRSGWGQIHYPLVVGHEIIGIAERVGEDVTDIRVGDRVGVGPQSDACLCRKPPAVAHDWSNCKECARGKENWCRQASTTYNGVFHSVGAKGARTMGGYARYIRCPSHFVFKIPVGLKSEHAAPMMCAGATVYSALVNAPSNNSERLEQHLKGMRIGIVGIGGLGHLAIPFARAMGADNVTAISRRGSKHRDSLELGAHDYIATDWGKDWSEGYADSFDLIISTVSQSLPITEHLHLLKGGGRYVMVGMPGDDGVVEVDQNLLVVKHIEIIGSLTSSRQEMRDMLQFAADKGIEPWVEMVDMENANEAVARMEAGMARYRIVLCNKH